MAIRFHDRRRTVTLPGSERAYAHNYCIRAFASVLGLFDALLDPQDVARLKRLLPADSYLQRIDAPAAFGVALENFLFAASDGTLMIEPHTGAQLRVRPLILNTALVAGSDPVRLLARLDGQCELNTYVEGLHRRWLAEIVIEGISSGILRRYEPGVENDLVDWPAVESLLRERADEPVVVSDSSAHGFPAFGLGAPLLLADRGGGGEDEEELDALWDALPPDEQWEYALRGLRQLREEELEMTPENWRGYRFGHEVNGFQLAQASYLPL